jgi:hypothetical protein|tara:strand:- start:140 stop:448 length:309 start_codon:yes stop_codon:yes gene_type:complete
MQNDHSGIKKIIDPKSGFTLYLRQFEDCPLAQVSSDLTFPTMPMPDGASMAIMQKELTAIQETNKHIASNQQMTTDHLLKRLHYLTVLVGILAVIGLAGILF